MTNRRLLSSKTILLIAFVLSLSLPPISFAQELALEFSSYESGSVRYDNMFEAELDILKSSTFHHSGAYLAERCPFADQEISPSLKLLHYCVTPEYVVKDLSQGSPFLYSGNYGAISVTCGICPVIDEFGNYLCESYKEKCFTEANVKTKIDEYYNNGSFCSYSLASETGWSFLQLLSNWSGWSPGSTGIYQVLFRKTLNYDVWRPSDYFGCADPWYSSNPWSVVSNTFTSCPMGYGTGSGVGYDPETGEPACLNRHHSMLQMYGNKEKSAGHCGTSNPCYPTTGVKTLTEPDLASATLPLVRYFHSEMWEQDFAAMGRGWSHTYSERLLEGINGVIRYLDNTGNVEQFICTDSPTCSIFRSANLAGSILKPIANGWEHYSSSGDLRKFDEDGKLISIEQRSGIYRLVLISYNAEDKVDVVVDQKGRSLQFSYNPDGLVEFVTSPSGDLIQYQYNQPSSTPVFRTWGQQLIKIIREDLTERNYHYEDQNPDTTPRHEFLITGITDENGVRYSRFTYDEKARVTSSELANGAGRVTLNYTQRADESENWTITELSRPLGEVEVYDINSFDQFRRPESISDSRGNFTITRNSRGWPVNHLDREGHQTTFVYADGIHESRRTEAVGTLDERIIETDWDNKINRVVERRTPGKTTHYTYNIRGQVQTRTEADTRTLASRTWTYTYYEIPSIAELIGQLATVDGPRTDVTDNTTYNYYTTDDLNGMYLKGDLHTISNALSQTTEYLEYDGNGRPLKLKDANNVVTTMTYHARGWIDNRSTDGQTTRFTYDNAGNLTRLTQPDGSFTDYEYDDAHRLDAIADNFNNRIEYTLDAAGNRTAENSYNDLGVLRRQMSRVYDQLSRLQKIIDGNLHETIFGYDSNGNRTSTQDPNLNSTTSEYDALGRLIKTIDATLGETLMGYDARNNPVTVTDPLGNTTVYAYDGLDNQTRLSSPDSGTTTFEFDAAGNRTAATDARGVRVAYSYDALNRLIFTDYVDSHLDVTFTYDVGANGAGRLASMTDVAGTETYAYDARGNLVSVVRLIGGTSYRTGYAYNGADRLTQVTYPSGMVVDYSLDAAGRVITVDKTVNTVTENLVTGVVYEPFGPVNTFTFGNGLSMSATFDRDYELDKLQSGSGLDWVFGHDNSGNLITITDQVTSGNKQTFSYDDLYRLNTATGAYGNETFAYDANGNRTRYLSDMVDDAYTYEPQSNRMVTQNGWSFNRDAVGNRLDKLDGMGYGKLYSYGEHNRLSEVTDRNASGYTVAGSYLYDGRGQRLSKITGGITTHFIFASNGALLGEYKDDGSPDLEYVYLNGQPVAVISSEWQVAPDIITTIMDNNEPGTTSNGSWKTVADFQAFGGDHQKGKKNRNGWYRWEKLHPVADVDIYARWVSHKSYSARAQYNIHVGSLVNDAITLSHKSDGDQWTLLGSYSHDGIGPVAVELSASRGKVSADAIKFEFNMDPGPGVLVETTGFIHTDHLGTPRVVTDDAQTTVWRWDSTPFGASVPDEDPDGDSHDFTLNLRFPGQYYDAESELHYNYFRTYDPSTGRYIESDPIGLLGGLNVFGYTDSNPYNFIDPSGLEVVGEWTVYPTAYDFKSSFPRWYGFDVGDARIMPPRIRLGFFAVDVTARIRFQIKCTRYPETGSSCTDKRPEAWFINHSDNHSTTIHIPYRWSYGKWQWKAARIGVDAIEKAKNEYVRIAYLLYGDNATLICKFGF